MSGGSLEYLYSKIKRAIDECYYFECYEIADTILGAKAFTYYPFRTKEHLRFYKHLEKVAKALHDLEWAMDGDIAIGGELKAIKAVLRKTRRNK